MDATYKTNNANLPLVEIVGIVSTGKNFHLAFAFIHNERTDTYLFVMQWLKSPFELCNAKGPRVIVTDRELASMKAIRQVFPEAAHLLYRMHIKMDCQNYLAKSEKTTKYEETFRARWDAVVFAPNEDAYEVAVESLKYSFRHHQPFLATSGLGTAAACALSKEGFYVVLVGRSSELLSKAVSDIKSRNRDACLKAFVVDLSSFKSILKFQSSLEQWLTDSNMHSSVQLLINNAGILATSSRVTSEGYDQMMSSNYIGAFCLTKVLLPLLENSPIPSRVVNVSSFTHRNVQCKQMDRKTVTGECFMKSSCYSYANLYEFSKFCILLFSYELHRQVCVTDKSHRLSVLAVDPGFVKTNIMREIPSFVSKFSFTVMKLLGVFQSPEIAIRSVLDAALAPPEVSGVYFFGGNGRTLNSSALSYDSKLAKDLWDTSCDIFQELQHSS